MLNIGSIRKYFEYEDRLSRVVSKVTGILILAYNLVSGILIIYFLGKLLFGISDPGFVQWIIYFLAGLFSGLVIFRFCILITDLITGRIEIEDYSYLRLLLMVTLLFYLFLAILYFALTILQKIFTLYLNK